MFYSFINTRNYRSRLRTKRNVMKRGLLQLPSSIQYVQLMSKQRHECWRRIRTIPSNDTNVNFKPSPTLRSLVVAMADSWGQPISLFFCSSRDLSSKIYCTQRHQSLRSLSYYFCDWPLYLANPYRSAQYPPPKTCIIHMHLATAYRKAPCIPTVLSKYCKILTFL